MAPEILCMKTSAYAQTVKNTVNSKKKMNIILKKQDDKYELEWRYLGKSYKTIHETHDEALMQVDENNRNRDIYEEKQKILKRMGELGKSDHMRTMRNAIEKMLNPEYRYNEASFRCATANSMRGYKKYKVQPITNKIIEL